MIPRLIASAPQRLTRTCRPMASRAITCQKRVPSGLLGAASKSPAASYYWQPRSKCSCVGSSTLASSPCCVGSATGIDKKQQTRGNSIAMSAAAAFLGGQHPRQHEYEASAEEIEVTTAPAMNTFLGDESSLLGKLKKINDQVGRKRNRGRTARPRRAGALSGLNSVQQILDQLTEATAQKTQKQQATANGPSLDMARAMPLSCQQMDNTSLMCLAAMDNLEARAEVVRRHIMDVDNVSYAEACETYKEIRDFNRSTLGVAHTIPYRIAIATATAAAFVSIPLCFHLPTVEFFNANFVNLEVPPDPESLRTWLGVGAWSWEWMEPPLGQLSFMILCLQVARNQLGTIGHKPYGGIIRQWRARKLIKQFPRFDETILSAYSKASPLVSPTR